MPRRPSQQNSASASVTRRTSARIAAVQAASPAKSPVKSPRPKRRSAEPKKTASEDSESQQSQARSESMEDLNGIENNTSVKDGDSVDLHELPSKKPKVETETDETAKESTEAIDSPKQATISNSDVADFEVVEKSSVPPPDSEEVKAAISVQGEDGQLLVGYVQVDRDELPSAESLEVKNVTANAEPTVEAVDVPKDSAQLVTPEVDVPDNTLNGDSKTEGANDVATTEPIKDHSAEAAAQVKSVDSQPQDVTSSASGDNSAEHASV